jgi:hypothetical protein
VPPPPVVPSFTGLPEVTATAPALVLPPVGAPPVPQPPVPPPPVGPPPVSVSLGSPPPVGLPQQDRLGQVRAGLDELSAYLQQQDHR